MAVGGGDGEDEGDGKMREMGKVRRGKTVWANWVTEFNSTFIGEPGLG